ncbi:MAG: hypothetical protein Q9218_001776 [Villophora microphyllina]
MASTGFEIPSSEKREVARKLSVTKDVEVDEAVPPYSTSPAGSLKVVYDDTHRRLKPRHIQLIGIGGEALARCSLRSPYGKSLIRAKPSVSPKQAMVYGQSHWV